MARDQSVNPPVTPKGRETQRALLDAGELVAARNGLSGLSVAAVTARAGVAKGTFYVHFPDREAFIATLRERFDAQVHDAVLAAVVGQPTGYELLCAAIEAYLDVCLAHRSIKALSIEARTAESAPPLATDLVDRFARLIGPSLQAMSLTPIGVHTRLLIALASEVAQVELAAGRRNAQARAALESWLQRLRPI